LLEADAVARERGGDGRDDEAVGDGSLVG